jgi:hypothetical protein
MLVLRDHASIGPRVSARRNGLIGAASLLVALALWILTISSASAGRSGIALGVGIAALLLSLTGYAFSGVARFARLYGARSAPLAYFGRDRFVVAPWVSRAGAIDRRPEGRFGAAIPTGELREVEVTKRDEGFVIELKTDHGPIDVLRTESEEVARYARDVVLRAAASVRHPGGPSARQRLRTRAKGGHPAVGT